METKTWTIPEEYYPPAWDDDRRRELQQIVEKLELTEEDMEVLKDFFVAYSTVLGSTTAVEKDLGVTTEACGVMLGFISSVMDETMFDFAEHADLDQVLGMIWMCGMAVGVEFTQKRPKKRE